MIRIYPIKFKNVQFYEKEKIGKFLEIFGNFLATVSFSNEFFQLILSSRGVQPPDTLPTIRNSYYLYKKWMIKWP